MLADGAPSECAFRQCQGERGEWKCRVKSSGELLWAENSDEPALKYANGGVIRCLGYGSETTKSGRRRARVADAGREKGAGGEKGARRERVPSEKALAKGTWRRVTGER
ncbi:hypothetical protein ACTI_08360 [Actinoplanes sp. OR16]|nr:hypothetical protein ACTI_08360 [Actinoplanes sp. OR16]